MPVEHLAVVMPAYNEVRGLPTFLDEILRATRPLVSRVSIVVIDDGSTDGTAQTLRDLGDPAVRVVTLPQNRGHGGAALAAYREGLALQADVVVHVDGDGQFLGSDFPAVVAALTAEGADVVHGIRTRRTDRWYRRAVSAAVKLVTSGVVGAWRADPNTPLRAYRPRALERVIAFLPETCLVPHVHFTIAEARAGLRVASVRVRSIPRRGEAEMGTMWGGSLRAPALPPRALLRFLAGAAAEVWRLSLRPGAPMRAVRRAGAS